MQIPKLFTCLLFTLIVLCKLCAQNPYHLTDGRENDPACRNAAQVINDKPKEVLFGIEIDESGDVYFVMDNRDWYNKIFSVANGITADIVSKNRYNCGNYVAGNGLIRGYVLPPLYVWNFPKNMTKASDRAIMIKIGRLPAELRGKELEGNLVIVKDTKICFYTNFLNIDRSLWDILPMGLYTDTLQQQSTAEDTLNGGMFAYSHKVQLVIPFEKNQASYTGTDVKRMYDSLGLSNYTIRKLDVRAYSSVEGTETANAQLMQARAGAMVAAIKKIQPLLQRVNITTAENWLQFYNDVQNTTYKNYTGLTKEEIKIKLRDKIVSTNLEPQLALEREAVVTIYYSTKTGAENVADERLSVEFSKAISEKNIQHARLIEKEIAERITDNRLPDDYFNSLEIPAQKDYSDLLNDREIYRYQLTLTDEDEALTEFKKIKKLDPYNGKTNYNICALTIFEWQLNPDSAHSQTLLTDINLLQKQGIDASLVKRMQVNYHILLSADLLDKYKYDEKDKSVLFIKDNYEALKLNDDDRFSLSKYFAYYSQQEWAEQLIEPRINQLDVSENLLFYYVNLGFFRPDKYENEIFGKALLNASTLNKQRFCHFFKSTDKGGAGMQLLEEGIFRKLYCQSCSGLP